jgi:hypothetical protein
MYGKIRTIKPSQSESNTVSFYALQKFSSVKIQFLDKYNQVRKLYPTSTSCESYAEMGCFYEKEADLNIVLNSPVGEPENIECILGDDI